MGLPTNGDAIAEVKLSLFDRVVGWGQLTRRKVTKHTTRFQEFVAVLETYPSTRIHTPIATLYNMASVE